MKVHLWVYVVLLLVGFILSLEKGSVLASTSSFSYTLSSNQSLTEWNPLRGLVPYASSYSTAGKFPHSMENFYLTMKTLMVNWNQFNWTTFDKQLDAIAARGHHAIPRVYVDYPGLTKTQSDAVPAFLINGLKFNPYSSPSFGLAPDFFNQTLIDAMVQLIQALGARYDGDNRIGVFQVGFLGHWGEFHMSPNNTLFPGNSIQDQILAAFNSSFKVTQINARYAKVIGSFLPSQLRMGYHDDSFSQDTLSYSWSFYEALKAKNGTEVWKTNMFGGELRPELWPCIFAANFTSACLTAAPSLVAQDWTACALAVRPSYMWDSYAFTTGYTGDDLKRARAGALQLGYRFTVRNIDIIQQAIDASQTSFELHITLSNVGLAPFYYPLYITLFVTYQLHNSNNTLNATVTDTQDLRQLLPGENRTFVISIPNESSGTGYPNPSNVAAIGAELMLTSSILQPSQRILFDVEDDSTTGASGGKIVLPLAALEQGSGSSASRLCSAFSFEF